MADNPPHTPPPSPNPAPRPTPPMKGTGLTGSLKNPTQRLPIRTAGGGKIVVMLSSVAKPPPANTQQLLRPPVQPGSPVLTPKPSAGAIAPPSSVSAPPPLPPKQVKPAPELPSPSRPQLSATTYVKLPPKTTAPGWNAPVAAPTPTPVPAPAPAITPVPPPKVVELTMKKPGAQHIPPIKLNEPSPALDSRAEESIFLAKTTPAPAPVTPSAVPKTPMPITTTAPMMKPDVAKPEPAAPVTPAAPPVAKAPEAKTPEGAPVSLDLFEKSLAPAPTAKEQPVDKPAPLKAPALMPPNLVTPPPMTGGGVRPVRPPPLTKPIGSALTPPAAPAKVEAPKLPEPPVEKPPVVLAKQEPSVSTPPSAENAILPSALDQPAQPVAEKLPPPLAAKPADTPITTPPALPPALPKLEKVLEPVVEKTSPPLAKPVEAPVTPGPLHVAPPMLEKAPEPAAEKLPQPHLPPPAPVAEARKADAPPGTPDAVTKPLQKAPAMIPSETVAPKPSSPPKQRRSITSWLKKTTPLVVSSASAKAPAPVAPVAEAKPALKPPTLPSRSMLVPAKIDEPSITPPVDAPKPGLEAKVPEKAPETPASATPPPIAPVDKAAPPITLKTGTEATVVGSTAIAAALAADSKKSKDKAKADAPAKPPVVPRAEKVEVPLTRAERARKRRIYSLAFFWAFLFPLTIGVLFYASIVVGRDTRLEGQVIPPPGTVLSNEVWIVTDFRSLASGITEDLAAERTPLMQEIQERQDHVQRAQSDVATREERIRLIQEEIAAHKSEIEAVVKQARDATQQVWDVEGAAIDNDYASRMNALKRTIADRAKSLNLKYTPDDTFDSPEVWANAYRLALYEVPAGVDGVKEHAWLSDQMKQWRDYQKSADDKKEALREKAAQIKLGPAPKITDLNAKIDDLQQRIDATEAEEVPLKAELQQAQADLVTAQSADVGLDDKYYKQLYSLPGESVIKRIPLQTNGRFTWLDDNVFLQGENQHSYYIFARATRADGRQYWSLGRISVEKNHVMPILFEPASFVSTKAILRPTLSPEEIEQ